MAPEIVHGPRTGLVDVLDRVLDKGLIVAGDVRVSLADVELLTIRIRLIICSIDKAEQIGLDWWRYDRHLTRGRRAKGETERLRSQVRTLQRRLAAVSRSRRPETLNRPAVAGRRQASGPGGS